MHQYQLYIFYIAIWQAHSTWSIASLPYTTKETLDSQFKRSEALKISWHKHVNIWVTDKLTG